MVAERGGDRAGEEGAKATEDVGADGAEEDVSGQDEEETLSPCISNPEGER